MPCNCDGMELSYARSKLEDAERDKVTLCKAQLLIHRLATILETQKFHYSEKLSDEVKEHRKIFLAHKRIKNKKDMEEDRQHFLDIKSKIERIKDLGGEPGRAILQELAEAKTKCILGNKTDEQLLNE